MPSVSEKQRKAVAIAEHEPEKLHAANKGMLEMSQRQLHDFARGPVKPSKVQMALRNISGPGNADKSGGLGDRPTLKNSKVYNRLKELKGGKP